MGKRKRNAPTIEEVLERPWCYYCERDFDDLKVLIAHQKAKHYKCGQCNRRLNTAGGLSVHMSQVHKETLTHIENALPGRADINVEIFGMHGIPDHILEVHKQKITTEYFRMVAERRAETGNPPPGANTDTAAKKPKIETPEEIRKRLAEHKAKREAEKEAKAQAERTSSTNSTPMNGTTPFQPPTEQNGQQQVAPSHTHFQPPVYHGSPVQAAPAHGPPQAHYGMPSYGSPMPPVVSPGNAPFFPPQGMPPHFAQSPVNGHPPMPPQGWTGPPSFAGPPPQQQFMPQRSQSSFSHKQSNGNHQSPTTPKQPDLPRPVSSLPVVPGLPSRPVVDAPSFSREDMARLHHGPPSRQGSAVSNTFSPSTHAPSPSGTTHEQAAASTPVTTSQPRQSDHIDDLINSITNGQPEQKSAPDAAVQEDSKPTTAGATAETKQVAAISAPGTPAQAETRSKSTGKKSKNANIKSKLVYSDNATSPEEKRALSKRYAFKRDESTQYVLGDVSAGVTGPVRGPDDVLDSQAVH